MVSAIDWMIASRVIWRCYSFAVLKRGVFADFVRLAAIKHREFPRDCYGDLELHRRFTAWVFCGFYKREDGIVKFNQQSSILVDNASLPVCQRKSYSETMLLLICSMSSEIISMATVSAQFVWEYRQRDRRWHARSRSATRDSSACTG